MVLVGHSRGGIVIIHQATEHVPARIAALVYLTAFNRYLILSDDRTRSSPAPAAIRNTLYKTPRNGGPWGLLGSRGTDSVACAAYIVCLRARSRWGRNGR
jgi:hypothetical protein